MAIAGHEDCRASSQCRVDELVVVGILRHPTRSAERGNDFRMRLEVIDDRVGFLLRDVELLDQLVANFCRDWIR